MLENIMGNPNSREQQIHRSETGAALPPNPDANQFDPNATMPVNPNNSRSETDADIDPGKSVAFDVDKNPEDMQVMTDTMMYAPMLKSMSKEQRKEKWPEIAGKLGQVSPKAKAMLDPTLPPTDADLDALISKMPEQKAVKKEDKDLIPAHKIPSGLNTEEMSDDELMNVGFSLMNDDDGDPLLKGAPKGHRWTDSTKRVLEPIPGGPADKSTKALKTEAAGKIMMMQTAKAALPTIKKLLFTSEGELNRENVMKSNMPIIGGSLPFSNEGRRLAQAYELAIQAITRVETGAAMPNDELNNTRERFQVNVWDTPDVALQKYFSLKLFLNGYLKFTYKGKDGKAHFDSTQADVAAAKLQLNMQNYKEDWMKRAMKTKGNENVTSEQLNTAFNKKLLFDEGFLKKMGNKMKSKS